MITKLTTPDDIHPEPEMGAELKQLIEDQLALVNIKKVDPNDSSLYRITVKIDGHYSKENCEEVKRAYEAIGWTSVGFRKEYPYYSGKGKCKCTYVTFLQKKPAPIVYREA